MTQTSEMVQADFDRIALLSSGTRWSHNSHYHGFLLRQLPARIEDALDIGCGGGVFARLLAARSSRVLGLDLSPQMVRLARESSAGYPNLEYMQADVMEWDFPVGRFDCVASIATLHHLPLEAILAKMCAGLRRGGTLLVLDLFKYVTVTDVMLGALASPAGVALKLINGEPIREPAEVRRAWQEHGRYDTYLPMSEVRSICGRVLPDAKVRRHLFYRYSIVWKKP
jgi:2-polyprenyl-3-methyl-5-hydroxy-6-metoxy-1,4-benzoquinol methylase